MAKHPSKKSVTLNDIKVIYGAEHFETALACFISLYWNPGFTATQVRQTAAEIYIPPYRLPLYHRLKFITRDPYQLNPSKATVVDSIHVEPERFDTAVISSDGKCSLAGVEGMY